MDMNGVDNVIEHWKLEGGLIGIGIGFILEVFTIRNSRKRPDWLLMIMSILAVGVFGHITFIIAMTSIPETPWMQYFWTAFLSAHTWFISKMVLNGRAFSLIELFLPEPMRRLLKRRNDDK